MDQLAVKINPLAVSVEWKEMEKTAKGHLNVAIAQGNTQLPSKPGYFCLSRKKS